MRSQVAKWGNSLAVRIPADCARATGLKAGDRVELGVTKAGEIRLVREQSFDKAAFLARLRKLRASTPMSGPVVERMRRQARY